MHIISVSKLPGSERGLKVKSLKEGLEKSVTEHSCLNLTRSFRPIILYIECQTGGFGVHELGAGYYLLLLSSQRIIHLVLIRSRSVLFLVKNMSLNRICGLLHCRILVKQQISFLTFHQMDLSVASENRLFLPHAVARSTSAR